MDDKSMFPKNIFIIKDYEEHSFKILQRIVENFDNYDD